MTETITLSEPIKIDGIETDKLNMREPIVADMLAVKDKPFGEQDLALFSNLCQIDLESMRSIKWKDYLKIQRTYSNLIGEENPLE